MWYVWYYSIPNRESSSRSTFDKESRLLLSFPQRFHPSNDSDDAIDGSNCWLPNITHPISRRAHQLDLLGCDVPNTFEGLVGSVVFYSSPEAQLVVGGTRIKVRCCETLKRVFGEKMMRPKPICSHTTKRSLC